MQAVLEEHIPGQCWVNGIVHPAHESCCHVSVTVEPFDMGQLSHTGLVSSYLIYTLSGQCPLSQFQNQYRKSSCREKQDSGFQQHSLTGMLQFAAYVITTTTNKQNVLRDTLALL
jgi:hypothetical protein